MKRLIIHIIFLSTIGLMVYVNITAVKIIASVL